MPTPVNSQFNEEYAKLRGAILGHSRGFVHTRKPWGSDAIVNLGAGFTVANTLTSESPFDAVRLVRHSTGVAGTAAAGMKASIAPTAKLSNNRDPVDAANAAVAPTIVTWNNLGVAGPAPSPPGSSQTQPTVLGGGATSTLYVEGHLFSDWMGVASLDRADAGETLPLLMIRNEYPNGGPAIYLNATQPAWYNDPAVHNGRVWGASYQGSGGTPNMGVTTPAGYTVTGGVTGYAGFGALQFQSRHRGLSVGAFGDSLTRGFGSQGNSVGIRPWGHIACAALSKLTRPITFANWGISGQNTANKLLRMANIIDLYEHDVVFIWPYTINDGAATMVAAQAGLTAARYTINRCISKGIVPVICTQTPCYPAMATANNAVRMAVNTEIRSWEADGLLVCDFDAVMRDPAAPGQMLQAYAFDGVSHPNDLGYAVMAEAAKAVLQYIIAVNFKA